MSLFPIADDKTLSTPKRDV